MRSAIRSLFAVVAVAITATGCKEDTIIRSDLIPAGDKIDVFEYNTDTLTILTKTIIIDTLNTSTEATGQPIVHGLGTVDDSYFGKTSAGIYFQVVPPTNEFTFPAEVDSAFVILPYTGFKWGDASNSSIQKLTVYRTTEVLGKDDSYFSNIRMATNEVLSKPFSYDMSGIDEDVVVLGAARTPHLRIPLDITSNLMQGLKDAAASSATTGTFINYLRGLYIEPDTTQGGTLLPYFFLNGTSTYSRAGIEFFYTTDSVRSLFFHFDENECAHYNRIKRDLPLLASLRDAANQNQEKILLQNEPGAAIEIKIPNLKSLPTGIINKATLEITQLNTGGADTAFTAPSRIVAYLVDANGKETTLPEAPGFADGGRQVFSSGGIKLVKYQINMANTIQNAISAEWDTLHLHIKGAKGFPGAYRLIAGGRNNPDDAFRTKLTIFYSKPQQ